MFTVLFVCESSFIKKARREFPQTVLREFEDRASKCETVVGGSSSRTLESVCVGFVLGSEMLGFFEIRGKLLDSLVCFGEILLKLFFLRSSGLSIILKLFDVILQLVVELLKLFRASL